MSVYTGMHLFLEFKLTLTENCQPDGPLFKDRLSESFRAEACACLPLQVARVVPKSKQAAHLLARALVDKRCDISREPENLISCDVHRLQTLVARQSGQHLNREVAILMGEK